MQFTSFFSYVRSVLYIFPLCGKYIHIYIYIYIYIYISVCMCVCVCVCMCVCVCCLTIRECGNSEPSSAQLLHIWFLRKTVPHYVVIHVAERIPVPVVTSLNSSSDTSAAVCSLFDHPPGAMIAVRRITETIIITFVTLAVIDSQWS